MRTVPHHEFGQHGQDGCVLPFLSNRDGTCAVEIFELLPMS
jgi:hypothetical protein